MTEDTGENYFYFYDDNGNVTDLIDETDVVVAHYAYDPFGKVVGQTGSLDQPFQFSTKAYHSPSGLNHYLYRWYCAIQGRWLNRDPIQEDGGLNLYFIRYNNGINSWDYLGLNIFEEMHDFYVTYRDADRTMDGAILSLIFGTANNNRHYGPNHPWTQTMKNHHHIKDIRNQIRGIIMSYCGGSTANVIGVQKPAHYLLDSQTKLMNAMTLTRDIFAALQMTSSAYSMGSFGGYYTINSINCSKCSADVSFELQDGLTLGSLTRVPGFPKSFIQFTTLIAFSQSPTMTMSQQLPVYTVNDINKILSLKHKDFNEPNGPNKPFNDVILNWSWSETVEALGGDEE